jgi:prophage antirepressor-like protein
MNKVAAVSIVPSFDFNGSKVEVQIDENGKEWFNSIDVCRCLGYERPNDAVSAHCRKDGTVKRRSVDSLGRQQQVNFITEPNLYRLVVKSKLPSAEDFEKWVFETVLPSIRKTGSYSIVKREKGDPIAILENFWKKVASDVREIERPETKGEHDWFFVHMSNYVNDVVFGANRPKTPRQSMTPDQEKRLDEVTKYCMTLLATGTRKPTEFRAKLLLKFPTPALPNSSVKNTLKDSEHDN